MESAFRGQEQLNKNLHFEFELGVLFVIKRYTCLIGKRNGSCGRKAPDPNPASVTAGRVAGLHLAYLAKFPPFSVLPLYCSAIFDFWGRDVLLF